MTPRPSKEGLRFLPLCLNTAGRHVLVVGSGREATLKHEMLTHYGARVTLCTDGVALAEPKPPELRVLEQRYDDALLEGVELLYACTSDRELNRRLGRAARARGILTNVVDDPTHCDFVTPAIFRQGEMSVAVSSNGQDVARSIAWRNAIRDHFDALAATPAATPAATRASAPSAQGGLATAKVWLVGFGPGDPELLTRKAHRLLGQVDVLFYDDLVDPSALAPYPGRKHYVGKRGGHRDSIAQQTINELLYQAAARGERVARVKAGDPSVFSRAGEELAYLRERGVEVEVVPGVSAAHAAAASSGFPLTMRGMARRVELRTGHCCGEPDLAPQRATLVYYMAAARLPQIASELAAEGWAPSTPVALVECATRPAQRRLRTTLAALPQTQAAAPLTLIVGDVVGLAPPTAFDQDTLRDARRPNLGATPSAPKEPMRIVDEAHL
ncbi:MAG: uroporphyrinogen-III C-methyltransferase [Proteobacteria bacterium]|nr:uroporphyrinogen-III C-methyltransferase [Pseudomonadota bacterium]